MALSTVLGRDDRRYGLAVVFKGIRILFVRLMARQAIHPILAVFRGPPLPYQARRNFLVTPHTALGAFWLLCLDEYPSPGHNCPHYA